MRTCCERVDDEHGDCERGRGEYLGYHYTQQDTNRGGQRKHKETRYVVCEILLVLVQLHADSKRQAQLRERGVSEIGST